MRTRTYRIVTYSFTSCFYSTGIRTRVSTSLIDTSHFWWTFWVNYTFRSATRWTSDVISQTWTDTLTIYFTTLWVRTTWWWNTRICSRWSCYGLFSTQEEWITCVPGRACAEWYVIFNITYSIRATCTNTRINAFISDTCKFVRAIVVCVTFSSTASLLVKRVSFICFIAETSSSSVIFPAFCIWSARWRIAWAWDRRSRCG